MTYLAMEMLLYLVCAAVLGLALGWLFWGASRRRQLAKQRAEMMTTIEAEHAAADKARSDLGRADAEMKRAVEAEKAASAKAITDLKEVVEAEQRAAQEARANLEKARLDLEEAVNAEKASASEAIGQAMRLAETHKAAASDAETKETQFLAEIEELRLLIGAEKLAAQSARAELARVRADMQIVLDGERKANLQTKTALDDIRATLIRTFGTEAAALAATSDMAVTTTPLQGTGSNPAPLPALNLDVEPDVDVDPELTITMPADSSDAETGGAINALFDPVDLGDGVGEQASDDADIEDREDVGLPLAASDHQHLDTDDRVEILPVSTSNDTAVRPEQIDDRRPDVTDDLQEINGIGAALEQLLNDNGCLQYRQLANFSPADLQWLSQKIDVVVDQIEEDRWVEQAKELHLKKYGRRHDEDAWLGSADNRETGS